MVPWDFLAGAAVIALPQYQVRLGAALYICHTLSNVWHGACTSLLQGCISNDYAREMICCDAGAAAGGYCCRQGSPRTERHTPP